MKRKFIFFAMMLLTLMGGVKWNVLNAQDDVVTIGGDATSYSNIYPIGFNYGNTQSQHIYTAEEINHAPGVIEKIALKVNVTATRNLTFYMKNTEVSALGGWEDFSDDDLVFHSDALNTAPTDGWLTIELDTPFEYNGANILLSAVDNTGSSVYTWQTGCAYSNTSRNASYYQAGTNAPSSTVRQPSIRFTFGEAGEVVPPSVPTDLTATAINHASIELTWGAAENAKKYYVYKDGEYLDETSATNYTVNNLSDGKKYCFTVKGVLNSSNVSEESDPACATTAVLPTPTAPTNLAAASVTHNSVTLTWDAVQYAESYTVSYETTEITVTENTCVVTGLTPETPYTFSVKAKNVKGSSLAAEISATTLEYNNPFEGKQFRIMVNSGNATGNYLNIFNYYKQSGSYANKSSVGAKAKANSEMQKFVIEDAGDGNYYLKNIAGYYIKCAQWNVDAYSKTEKTALTFEYVNGSEGPFYLRDSEYTDGKSDNYFKVEYDYGGAYSYNYHVYSDQPINNDKVVTWVLEELVLSVDATADNDQIYDDQTATLNANVADASGDCTYSWTLNGEVVGTEATYTFTPSTTGMYTFTLTVTDSKNATATDDVTVNVNARLALAIGSITAEKELIYNNDETTTLTVNATNGYAPYTYSWTLNEEVVGTNATYTFSNKTVGEYTLTCTVKDSRNNTATASKTITVKDISEKPSEIEIGTDEKYDKYMPTHAYYGNSYTQQIYTAAEIGIDGGTITEIAFKKYNSNTADRKIKVFMLNTTKESFVSTSNWVTVGDDDLVFDGTCNFSGNAGEWTTITLTNEFNYTGGNILLCVSDYTNSWVGTYPQFYVYEGKPSNRSLYTYQDSTPYGDNCSQSGTRRSVLNHIKFNYKPAAPKAPKAPANLAVLNDENIFIEKDRDIVLTWDAVENATEYYVYKDDEFVGQTTEATYTVTAEDVVYSATPIIYAVSAKNDVGESEEKAQVSIIVTGYGNINGVVTNKETKEALAGITIWLSGTTAFGEDLYETISLEDGSFNKDVLEGSYTITISHDDYKEYVSTEILDVTYLGDTYIEIELEAKPEAIFAVTATESGSNANIEWNAEYVSYNIYRKDTQTGEIEELGRNISANQYQDTVWLSLENTAYQYGVSANIGSGSQMGILINEDFEYYTGAPLPDGWISNGNWSIIADGYNSDHSIYSGYNDGPHYLITPAINPKNATLSFAYRNLEYWSGYCELDVFYVTSPNGQLSESLYHKSSSESWETINLELNDIQENQIYIVICNTNTNGGGENGLFIDNIVITGEATSYKESKINWSNVLKKAVFLGTVDTDWNNENNWSTGQVPGENNNVTIAANAVISSDVTINTITINENASLSINNAVLNVTYGIYNTIAENLIFSDGAQIIQPKDNVAATFNMNINPTVGDWNENNTTGWQFISLPFADAEFEDFTSNSEDYDLYKYNGNKDNEWSNHKYVPTTETITVGDGDNVESYMPSSINYNYTVSQQIYLAEDLQGKTGKITGYSFKHAKNLMNNDGSPYTTTRQFEIYMINTGKSYFESGSDWVNVQDSDLVFSGSVSISTIGWVTIEFDTPFKYEEGKNVILCINDITGAFTPMATNYYKMNDTEKNRSIYARRDENGKYNPSEFDISGYVQKYVAQAEFLFETNTDGDIFGDTFQQGLGYLASYKSGTTATFEGTLNNATTFDYEVSHNADKYLANFHLLGNPFTFNMEWSKVQGEGLVEGYAIVNNEGGYDYLTTGTIPVGDGFFVKANAEDPTLYYDHSYVAPVLRGSEKSNSINVIATGKAGQDNVVINFAGQSEGFDKLQNFNKDIATVFVANNGKRYGIANVDENVAEVELSFVASQMGHYSISLDVNGEFETVTLVDRFTGIETNMLLEDEYTFTATSNDNVNRFVVRLTNGQQTTANSQFVYQSGEELILSIEGSVQIVDMLGRVVYSNEHANGNNRISVAEFNDAAYVVRVVNEEGVKSQKVVIY